jgi:glycosyltransferase involved in cell wall biosynthesis
MLCENLPPIEGGIENHVHNLARKLGEHCYVSLLSSTRPEGVLTYEKKGNVETFRPDAPKLSFIANLKAGIELAQKNRVNIIHAHTLGRISIIATIAGLVLRRPVIVTVHESHFIMDMTSKKSRLRKQLVYFFLLKQAKIVIAPSKELCYYVRNVAGNNRDVREIANGVDIIAFKPAYESHYLKTDLSKTYIVLCPRRITPKNGIIYLIEAIPRVVAEKNDVHFVFAGPVRDQDYFNRVQTKVEELNIKKYVTFTGGIPFQEMPRIYAEADLVVIPSLIEAVSLAALEAMASGIPVVATNVGGLPELITNNCNGLLVSPSNSKELAEAILRLLNNPKLARFFVRNAYVTAKDYSWSNVAEKTLNAYFDALKGT